MMMKGLSTVVLDLTKHVTRYSTVSGKTLRKNRNNLKGGNGVDDVTEGIPLDPLWEEREKSTDKDLLDIDALIHNETDGQLGQEEDE